MSERSGFFMIFPIAFFVVGALVPVYRIGLNIGSDAWRENTVCLMYLSLIVLLAWVFAKIQEKHQKFKRWSTDTVLGLSITAFAYSFFLSFGVAIYMLLPLPSMVTFIASITVSVLAFAVFMEMGRTKD